MKELNHFMNFLIEHKDDERVSIHRKIKFGFKHFYIEFFSDKIDRHGNPFQSPSMQICIDNRNKCIEISSYTNDHPVIIEDEEMILHWSDRLEKILNDENEPRLHSMIENAFINCENKNLHREFLMKKIINDESV